MLPLLLVAALVPIAPVQADSAASVRPIEQRLELQLDPAARAWSGSLLAKLDARGAARRVRLRLAGPVVSAVELSDREGRVEVVWGLDRDGLLLVEAARALAPGGAWLNVAFGGEWAAAAPGLARDSARTRAWLERGAAAAVPEWPGSPATRWTLLVHAPRACEVRASGRRASVTENRGWKAWTFRTPGVLPADSLRVAVRRAARRAR